MGRMATPLLLLLDGGTVRFISPGSSHHQGILIWHGSSRRCSPPPPSEWHRKNQEPRRRGRSSVIDRPWDHYCIAAAGLRYKYTLRVYKRFNLSEGLIFIFIDFISDPYACRSTSAHTYCVYLSCMLCTCGLFHT
jgi:hypothetical protein